MSRKRKYSNEFRLKIVSEYLSSQFGGFKRVAPNLIDRNFQANAPNQKWTTDITEFSLSGKKLYVSPVLDMYNGEIISYHISEHSHLRQVMDMLDKAKEDFP